MHTCKALNIEWCIYAICSNTWIGGKVIKKLFHCQTWGKENEYPKYLFVELNWEGGTQLSSSIEQNII